MKNVAVACLDCNVAKILGTPASSAPASNVSATTRRRVGSRPAICPTRILLGFVGAALAARSGRSDAGAVRLRVSLGAAVRAGRGRERVAAAGGRGLDPL